MKARLIGLNDIPDNGTAKVDFFGREVLVYKHAGKPRAVLNYCLHLGGPLELQGDKFVCGWHGAEFAGCSGVCQRGPAPQESQLMFLPTQIERGELWYVYGE